MSIVIRKRKLSAGKIQLYLDIYHKGRRKAESIGLCLTADREGNKKIMELARHIKAKRELEITSEMNGIKEYKLDSNFFQYADSYYERKSINSRNVYHHMSAHLKSITNQTLIFREINKKFCESFKNYLYENLKPGTALAYFLNFKSVLSGAVDDDVMVKNPANGIKLSRGESYPKYLTMEELERLVHTPASNKETKNAFIFSCWTGLRYSDIHKLCWMDIRDGRIEFTQQKTNSDNIVPLSSVALDILDKQKVANLSTLVFNLPAIQSINHMLKHWAKKAGVNKNISFHVARHTFATLALSCGIDIYIVSKLLGHRNIGTTTIYAKIIDSKRTEAIKMLPKIAV